MKRYGATQNVIYLRTLSNNMDFQSNYLHFQVFSLSITFDVNISFCDLYYESSLSCACKFSRGGYVNIENLYKSVFRQTRLEKHLEYDNPRLQTQKRAQIEYWGVTRHSAGEQMRALFFVAIQ